MVKRKKIRKVKSTKHVKVKKSKFWQYSTLFLGVLLVISIFTNGFNLGTNVNSVLSDLNQLNAKETSPQVKNALTQAITALENVMDKEPTPTGEGKIIIEEFSDFQCPFCKRVVPTIQQVKQEYGNQVEVVYKHFPLSSIHPNAQKAAEASECALDQGKFWEMHDKLFENQQALDDASLKRYAADLGLDASKFNICLDSGEKSAKVLAEFNEGRQKGVTGTPTFFINGQKIVGAQPFTNFKAIIDTALSGEAPAQPTQPSQPTEPAQPTPTAEARVSIDDDPVKGSEDAKVVIVEFGDFQCPFCSRFYSQTLPSIESEYIDTGKVKLVYRDYPLSFHAQATPSAEASECADEQGMFWEFHDKVFDNQGAMSVDNYKAWAAELGLDTEQFNDCVDSRKYQSEVVQDFSDGSASGVRGTPGFIIGVLQEDGQTVVGQSIRGAQPYANFKAAIDQELAKI